MLKTILAMLGGAIILLLPVMLNGSPLFYFDSSAYIELFAKAVAKLSSLLMPEIGAVSEVQPIFQGGGETPAETFGRSQDDGVVYTGRSIYYGALAYLGWITTIWLPVVLQCLVASGLIVSIFRLIARNVWIQASLLSITLLTIASSLSYFTSLVMPDIWAGLAILSLALLWNAHENLSFGGLLMLFAILTFSALAHQSHLALIAIMVAGYIVVLPFLPSRTLRFRQILVVPVLALIVGVAGQAAFTKVVILAYDQPPVSRPMITAHLVDLGPGTAYAHASCPESGHTLCAYKDRLPTDWISFLFSPSDRIGVFATVDAQTQRALTAEQFNFAVGTITFAPLETLGGLMGDGLKQFMTLSLTDVALTERQSGYLMRNFPPDLVALVQSSQMYARPYLAPLMTRVLEITTGVSAVLILIILVRWRKTPTTGMLAGIVLVCLAGFAANALICGILASPYGRFQARVAWILPLVLFFILSFRHTHDRAHAATG